jgi:CRP-like cAMP-binding protein
VDRRLKALAAVEILKPLRKDELLTIAERIRYAPFAPGEPITRQGAVAHWLYIMMTGTAEVRVNFDGVEKVLTRIDAPDFFGEMGLMTGEPRTATVVALTEVECYRLDKEAFIRIIKDRPEIASEISDLLANRRVALEALRQDMDAEAKARCIDAEKHRLLGTIERFFGLGDEEQGV